MIERNPQVAHRLIDDRVILVNLETNQVFELNDTAGRVWQLLEHRKSFGDLISHLREEFEVEEGEAQAEVRDLVNQMIESGLLLERTR